MVVFKFIFFLIIGTTLILFARFPFLFFSSLFTISALFILCI